MKNLTLLLLFLCTTSLQAQMKIGRNPTNIGATSNLEVEAVGSQKVIINRNDGRTYIENKPSATTSDSIVMRAIDGEIRQMSFSRFSKLIIDNTDSDGDGIINSLDTDDDNDGVADTLDRCILQYGCASTPANGSTHGCPVNCSSSSGNTTSGTLGTLDCNNPIHSGFLTSGVSAVSVSTTINYTNGNGGTYNMQTIASTGVTGLTATLLSGTLANGNGSLNLMINGTPSSSGTASFILSIGGQSCLITRIVNGQTPSNAIGSGSLSGKTCFDIATGNNNTGSCGPLTTRNSNKSDFTLPSTYQQTYTFTPSGTVSNVRFLFVNTNGAVISSISGGNAGNSITGPVNATVIYNTSLNALATGRTNNNPLTADIYVVYNNSANNSGSDQQIKVTATIKDCSCCGAMVGPTVWKEFLCHNLGADESLDPHDLSQPNAWGLNGAYIGYGRRGPSPTNNPLGVVGLTGDSRLDWKLYPTVGSIGFAAAPTGPLAAQANFSVITNWPGTGGIPSGGGWNFDPSQSTNQFGGLSTATNDLKAPNDPCPGGYRLPTHSEWTGVITYNTISRTGTTWSNSTISYNSGIHFGPNSSSRTLTLPACGYRQTPIGSSGSNPLWRGTYGSYWAKDFAGGTLGTASFGKILFFTSNGIETVPPSSGSSIIPDNTTIYRPQNIETGNSVRCIKE